VLHGQEYVLRIRERLTQEVIPMPPRKNARQSQPGWEPDFETATPRYRCLPTGTIRMSIVGTISSYEHQRTEDTSASRVEARLSSLITRLEAEALRCKVQADMYAERARERERLSREWQTRKEAKDKFLFRLAGFEDMAKNLDRAKSLRRLKARLETSMDPGAVPREDLELLARLVDWLDPSTHAPWPGVDDVPDRNPYGLHHY
jgi:hypothetical protein